MGGVRTRSGTLQDIESALERVDKKTFQMMNEDMSTYVVENPASENTVDDAPTNEACKMTKRGCGGCG